MTLGGQRLKHSSRILLRAAIAVAAGALTAPLAARATDGGRPAKDSAALTGFSWERVPLYLHFGKRSAAMTDAELDFVARHAGLVALEKGHGAAAFGSTEEGIYHTARELKRRNPAIKVLFYFNAFINWQPYDAFKTYNSEWTLRDRSGKVVTHPSGTPRPDPSIPAMREWWSDTVAEAMRRAPLNGVFADAFPQAISPALARQVGPEKAKAIVAGLREMVRLTKARIGPSRVILANGTRTHDFREILDWAGLDGVMIEHFGGFNTQKPEDIRADLETIRLAEEKGKFVVLKGWPGFNWLDQEMMAKPHDELLRRARANLEFPLACFLIAARPGSFFCYSWGYGHHHGMLDAYPEFGRPLGPPRGEAGWEGLTARREFAHASVWVDVAAKRARIEWRSP